MGSFREYLDARERNRKIFEQDEAVLYDAFETSNQSFEALLAQLGGGRDANGKSHISLLPFFFIFQRQAIASFDALSTNQAFLAWGLVRPGIESALIMGKWVDDPANATIWSNRKSDPKSYAKSFQGAALRSVALPRSQDIQLALSAINDRYLHPNPSYYYRHLEMNPLDGGGSEVKLNFFDEPIDIACGILGVLHLVAVVQDSLAAMFAKLFVSSPRLDVGLADLEEIAGTWAQTELLKGPEAAEILHKLGLWP